MYYSQWNLSHIVFLEDRISPAIEKQNIQAYYPACVCVGTLGYLAVSDSSWPHGL